MLVRIFIIIRKSKVTGIKPRDALDICEQAIKNWKREETSDQGAPLQALSKGVRVETNFVVMPS